jgi:hypothetical protein
LCIVTNDREFWPFSDIPSDAISIYEGPEVFLQNFEEADRKSQVAFAAYWLQSEVLNGGLGQFFSNDTGILAPEAAAACRTLGLPRLASELEQAMAWFGFPYPRQRQQRQEALESNDRDGNRSPFDDLDEVVANLIYEEATGLEQAAINYLRSAPS